MLPFSTLYHFEIVNRLYARSSIAIFIDAVKPCSPPPICKKTVKRRKKGLLLQLVSTLLHSAT